MEEDGLQVRLSLLSVVLLLIFTLQVRRVQEAVRAGDEAAREGQHLDQEEEHLPLWSCEEA